MREHRNNHSKTAALLCGDRGAAKQGAIAQCDVRWPVARAGDRAGSERLGIDA